MPDTDTPPSDPLPQADVSSPASGRHRRVEPLGTGWLTVTVVIGIMAALIAVGGMVLSFRAVSTEMIPTFGARWAWLVPIVVDLTVLVFSGVDLVLARLDMSHPLARWTVYGATGGTVWLNYSAGGDTAGRVAHVLMPSIWVMFIELMRHVVRRQANLATGTHREPIPAARWLLSPWPTLKLWRRMVLWQIRSYPRALDQEKQRLAAVAVARELHGRLWRSRISPLTRLEINLGEIGPDRIGPTRPRSVGQAARPDSRESGANRFTDPGRVGSTAGLDSHAAADPTEPTTPTHRPESVESTDSDSTRPASSDDPTDRPDLSRLVESGRSATTGESADRAAAGSADSTATHPTRVGPTDRLDSPDATDPTEPTAPTDRPGSVGPTPTRPKQTRPVDVLDRLEEAREAVGSRRPTEKLIREALHCSAGNARALRDLLLAEQAEAARRAAATGSDIPAHEVRPRTFPA